MDLRRLLRKRTSFEGTLHPHQEERRRCCTFSWSQERDLKGMTWKHGNTSLWQLGRHTLAVWVLPRNPKRQRLAGQQLCPRGWGTLPELVGYVESFLERKCELCGSLSQSGLFKFFPRSLPGGSPPGEPYEKRGGWPEKIHYLGKRKGCQIFLKKIVWGGGFEEIVRQKGSIFEHSRQRRPTRKKLASKTVSQNKNNFLFLFTSLPSHFLFFWQREKPSDKLGERRCQWLGPVGTREGPSSLPSSQPSAKPSPEMIPH